MKRCSVVKSLINYDVKSLVKWHIGEKRINPETSHKYVSGIEVRVTQNLKKRGIESPGGNRKRVTNI